MIKWLRDNSRHLNVILNREWEWWHFSGTNLFIHLNHFNFIIPSPFKICRIIIIKVLDFIAPVLFSFYDFWAFRIQQIIGMRILLPVLAGSILISVVLSRSTGLSFVFYYIVLEIVLLFVGGCGWLRTTTEKRNHHELLMCFRWEFRAWKERDCEAEKKRDIWLWVL